MTPPRETRCVASTTWWQALFDPALINAPTGPGALRLWELVTGWLEFPGVYELQRLK